MSHLRTIVRMILWLDRFLCSSIFHPTAVTDFVSERERISQDCSNLYAKARSMVCVVFGRAPVVVFCVRGFPSSPRDPERLAVTLITYLLTAKQCSRVLSSMVGGDRL